MSGILSLVDSGDVDEATIEAIMRVLDAHDGWHRIATALRLFFTILFVDFLVSHEPPGL